LREHNSHLPSAVGFLSSGREFLFMEATRVVRENTFSVVSSEVLEGSDEPESDAVGAIADSLMWWWGRVRADAEATLAGDRKMLELERERLEREGAGREGAGGSPSGSAASSSAARKENTHLAPGVMGTLTRHNLSLRGLDDPLPRDKLNLLNVNFLEAFAVADNF
jgi:hypothetical protein